MSSTRAVVPGARQSAHRRGCITAGADFRELEACFLFFLLLSSSATFLASAAFLAAASWLFCSRASTGTPVTLEMPQVSTALRSGTRNERTCSKKPPTALCSFTSVWCSKCLHARGGRVSVAASGYAADDIPRHGDCQLHASAIGPNIQVVVVDVALQRLRLWHKALSVCTWIWALRTVRLVKSTESRFGYLSLR